MQKNSFKSLSFFVMALLLLVPVLQALPLGLPPLLPEASAQGNVNLSNHASTSGTLTSSPYQITLSNFNAGTLSNRLLVVGVEANNQSVSSVTFGGTALTRVAGSFHNQDTELWYLLNPSGTANIVVTMGGATQVVVGAYAFYGVDQRDPIPTTATYWGSGNPKISLNTEFANSTIIDSPSIFGGATLSSPTCTQEWNINIANKITGASSLTTKSMPGSVTCSWTASIGGDGWDDAAVEIKASGVNNPLTQVSLYGKSTASGSAASVTIYGFKPGPDSNRTLVLAVETNNQAVSTTTKPTFGSQTFVQSAAHHFTHDDTEFWYLTNPSSTSHDITITFQGTTGFVAGVYAFSGVNQTSPIATTATNVGSSGNPTISLTTKYYNSWVLDSPSIFGGSTLSSPTCSQQWDVNRASQVTGASSYIIPIMPKSTTCTWTNSVSSNGWDDAAIEVRPYNPTTGVLVPLYSYPNPTTQYDLMIKAHNSYPSVRMIEIINENSGYPVDNDSNWLNETQYLQKNGIIVIGYVDTGYDCTNLPSGCTLGFTAPSLSRVKAEMSNYTNFYHVNGTFFDDMSSNANSGNLTYYDTLSNYSKYTLNQTLTVGNPGDEPDAHFNATFDTLNIYEGNSTLPTTNDYASWNTSFNENLFSVLAYNITSSILNSTYYNSTAKHAGYLYFTDDGKTKDTDCSCNDPWDQLSTYLSSTLSSLTHD